jgi:hypothetical protein
MGGAVTDLPVPGHQYRVGVVTAALMNWTRVVRKNVVTLPCDAQLCHPTASSCRSTIWNHLVPPLA